MLHSNLDHIQYTENCKLLKVGEPHHFSFQFFPKTITDELSKETFILQCLTLELWTTVGGPIGDGHMVRCQLSKRIEIRFVLLLLLLPNVFAHFTKNGLTWPLLKLGPPDFAW